MDRFNSLYSNSRLSGSASHCCIDKPLILAVDDDEDNLLLLKYALEPLHCNCLTACDGESAVSLAQAYHPDLILLDVMLPKLSGIGVVSQLRLKADTMTIPIVAVTALAKSEDKMQLLVAGFNDYLSKPYMLDDLEAMIGRYLAPKVPTP